MALLAGALAAVAGVAAIVFCRSAPEPPQNEGEQGAPRPVPMEFTRTGVAGEITQALEPLALVRPGRVQTAVWPRRTSRWFCVLVDGDERYYELAQGMKTEHFAGLTECGFKPLPSPLARRTSIYRAVARRAVPEFSEAHGDRILVLLCPRADWPTLTLHWPAPSATPK